jgi:hypothetical protein
MRNKKVKAAMKVLETLARLHRINLIEHSQGMAIFSQIFGV